MRLDPKKLSQKSANLLFKMNNRLVGQDRGVRYLVRAIQKLEAGIQDPRKPLCTLLLMGPTGVGKTEMIHALAESLLLDWKGVTEIDCAEYQREHEISKLIGSPPGYVGDKTEPRLSQRNIDQYQTTTRKINIVLFDEIEKADGALHDLLLGILSKGEITLGDGKKTDFTQTVVAMTCNLGSNKTTELLKGPKYGFVSRTQRDNLDQNIYVNSKEAAKKFFRPEFMNRIDKLIVCRSLDENSLSRILHLELNKVQRRLFLGSDGDKTIPIIFTVSKDAKAFLLKEGTSEEYGARELKRAIERFVTEPLSALLATRQIKVGDRLAIGFEDGGLVFNSTQDLSLIVPPVPYVGSKPEDLVN